MSSSTFADPTSTSPDQRFGFGVPPVFIAGAWVDGSTQGDRERRVSLDNETAGIHEVQRAQQQLSARDLEAVWSEDWHVFANGLGHADPSITLRVYAHVLKENATGVANIFATAVGKEASSDTKASEETQS